MKVAQKIAQREIQSFLVDGRMISYEVFLSGRARYARIQISPDLGLRVILPHHFPLSEVSKMLLSRQEWITDKIRMAGKSLQLVDGSVLRILDREMTMILRESALVEMREHFLYLPVRYTRDAFRHFLKEEARKYFAFRLPELSRRVDISFTRFSVRNQKTRWGSASRRRTISLNYKLVLMPLWVSDYVMIHELCHLVYMNHSPRFWNLVASHCPCFREARQWLKKQGKYLMV